MKCRSKPRAVCRHPTLVDIGFFFGHLGNYYCSPDHPDPLNCPLRCIQRLPFRIYELTEAFNPQGFVSCVEQFLEADASILDAAYSLKLQQEAWQQGEGEQRDLAAAIEFMLSEQTQQEMVNILVHASASSLDVIVPKCR